MNADSHKKYIERVLYQKNIFSFISIVLSIALLIAMSFLFFKKERIVVVPAVTEKEFWVEGNCASPTYLEQFGLFLGQLLFTKSAYTASEQRQIVLRHVSPESSDSFRKKLYDEELLLKKQNANYVFYPVHIDVLPKNQTVVLTGDRITYIGSKETSVKREVYELRFCFKSGRLLLKEVVAGKNAGE